MKQRYRLSGLLGTALALSASTVHLRAEAEDLERDTFQAYQEIFRPEEGHARRVLAGLERAALYQMAVENPVATLDDAVIGKYDPTGAIGFCFGRAMTAQLGARELGLSLSSLKKLFIVGALCSGCTGATDAPEWRFHVTTVVKGEDRKWYAIDPIMHESGPYRPLTVERWIERVREGWDRYHGGEPRAKLYLTPPDAILPDITTLPSPETGERLIELNFVPESHGLRALRSTNRALGLSSRNREKIYALTAGQAAEYFLTTSEREADRFRFLDIRIDGDAIPYNGYFVDLLKTDLEPDVGLGGEPGPGGRGGSVIGRTESAREGARMRGGFSPALLGAGRGR